MYCTYTCPSKTKKKKKKDRKKRKKKFILGYTPLRLLEISVSNRNEPFCVMKIVHTVEPLHNGHLGDITEKVAVVERWPLLGGRGVIRHLFFGKYMFIVTSSCLL